MQYGASVDQDRAAIRLRLLSDAADRMQGVARCSTEVLTQPVFPEAALARAKAQTVAGLRQEETSPQAVFTGSSSRPFMAGILMPTRRG